MSSDEISKIILSGDEKILNKELNSENFRLCINNCNSNGDYPIHSAIKSKNINILKSILDIGANPNQGSEGNRRGYTATHLAAIINNVEMIILLKKYGANLCQCSDDNWQPLHCAAFRGNLDAIITLLDNGANINCIDNIGQTPLMLSCIHGRINNVNFLLSRGASMNLLDSNGDSIFHLIFYFQLSKLFEGKYEVPERQIDIALLMVIYGYSIELKNKEGDSAFLFIKRDFSTLEKVLKFFFDNRDKFKSLKTECSLKKIISFNTNNFIELGLNPNEANDLYNLIQQLNLDCIKRREGIKVSSDFHFNCSYPPYIRKCPFLQFTNSLGSSNQNYFFSIFNFFKKYQNIFLISISFAFGITFDRFLRLRR